MEAGDYDWADFAEAREMAQDEHEDLLDEYQMLSNFVDRLLDLVEELAAEPIPHRYKGVGTRGHHCDYRFRLQSFRDRAKELLDG
jgi:hypothetical protein